MFSKLFETVDLTSYLIIVKNCPTDSLCFYGQNRSKIYKNMFHALLHKPINKKTDPLKKNLRRSNMGRGQG